MHALLIEQARVQQRRLITESAVTALSFGAAVGQ